MLVSYDGLVSLVQGKILYTMNADGEREPIPLDNVNSASIDIRLGRYILVEHVQGTYGEVSLKDRNPLNTSQYDLRTGPYSLEPGEFILAQSMEVFNLPRDVSCEYKLKSSMARIGLEHLNAGWCDAGWTGSVLTLELKNMTRNHKIVLHEGDGIGQMVFFFHDEVKAEHSYATRGRYNNDSTVSGIKE